MDLVGFLARQPVVRDLAARALAARRLTARGSVGASTGMLAAALARVAERPVLLVVAHLDEADEVADSLHSAGVPTLLFPALQSLPGETAISLDLLAARLNVVQAVAAWGAEGAGAAGQVLVAPMEALMQPVPSAAQLAAALTVVQVGEGRGPAWVVRWLDAAGYRRTDAVEEPGDYAPRGGILDIFPPGDPGAAAPMGAGGLPISPGGIPVRLDFFGDTLEKVTEIDLDTMGSDRTVGGVRLITATAQATSRAAGAVGLAELLPARTLAVLHELLELTEQGRGYYERLTDAKEVFGPPAVFKSIGARCAAVVEVTAIGLSGQGTLDLPVSPPPRLAEETGQAVAELAALAGGSRIDADGGAAAEGATVPTVPTERPLRTTVFCQTAAEKVRLAEMLAEHGGGEDRVAAVVQYLHQGFVWTEASGEPVLALPYHELLHRFEVRRRLGGRGGTDGGGGGGGAARLRAGRAMDTFLDIQVGDYVVHTEHGIAVYMGLKQIKRTEEKASVEERLRGAAATREARGEAEEFLTLQFEGGSLLHVPASKIDQVQKYVGGFRGKPPLSTIGGARWRNQKERVKESVKDLAAQLLRVRAAREHLPGIRYPADTPWQREFEAEFPHQETDDQLAALAEIKRDMQSARPMDRLLCGDVGYGKTEMAIRAAFKAVEYGKQAAVLVPTTVLAEQHERTFRARFKSYPFRIESISRFKTDAEVRAVLKELAAGRVDVLIGTHRIISQDVKFADLGLVVIDEEQRFGVEHKEKLLALRMTVDVLTMSATPIPRTLHLSMLGLRDISSLSTAPLDRRAVVTEVMPWNTGRLEQALRRELAREGQAYFVHNRVNDIHAVAAEVQALAPDARIVVGHGQMAPKELEDVMLKFMRRQADILVSTTIIESGIDNPTANTMIIADADRFGLADLHQLRGRVGRYKHRAYCYLLLPKTRPVKEKAKHRLKAIEQYSMLGAGFKIAMRDLEIRGAGNILGPEQSGHIAAVGYEMYCQLLDRSVRELRSEITTAPSETSIEIGVTGTIPKGYIPSDARRLEAYRRLALAVAPEDLARVETDLTNAYGPIPEPVQRLIDLAAIRVGARLLQVRTVSVRDKDVIIRTLDPAGVAARFEGASGTVTALPTKAAGGAVAAGDVPEVYYRPSPQSLEPRTLLAILKKRLGGTVPRADGSGAQGAGGRPGPLAGDSVNGPTMPRRREMPLGGSKRVARDGT